MGEVRVVVVGLGWGGVEGRGWMVVGLRWGGVDDGGVEMGWGVDADGEGACLSVCSRTTLGNSRQLSVTLGMPARLRYQQQTADELRILK